MFFRNGNPRLFLCFGRQRQIRFHLAARPNNFLDRAGKFRVIVGPVGWERFQRFLPDGDEFATLVALTRLFVTDPLQFDVEVRLKGEEVPDLRLGGEKPYRVGWTTWIPADDMEDQAVVFRVPEADSSERKAS